VVWRRTKLGLRMTADQIAALEAFMLKAAKDGVLSPAAE
jgi:glycerol-3-phosphate dehydrogenase